MISRATIRRRTVVKIHDGHWRHEKDAVVVEEPLEIRLALPNSTHTLSLATLMRTPGADIELAAGFLFSEGIIDNRCDIATIRYCVDAELAEEAQFNTLIVTPRRDLNLNLDHLRRLFIVSSSCGVCGKASPEALRLCGCAPLADDPPVRVSCAALAGLDKTLRQAQDLFARTGGLHAAALFTSDGRLLAIYEDIGRHNALDKLIGTHLLADQLNLLRQSVLLVSGRASFEIMQKALMARIPVVVAVGAPSELAITVAQHFNLTLIGFLRGAACNIYAGAERVVAPG